MYYDTRSLDHFLRVSSFIFVPYYSYTFHILCNPHSYAFHTFYFTFVYKLTRNIFPIPDDAVDRRKLGSQLLILTVVLHVGLISTFIFLFQNAAEGQHPKIIESFCVYTFIIHIVFPIKLTNQIRFI